MYARYMDLDTKRHLQATYVWIGGSDGVDLRCKTRTIRDTREITHVSQLVPWHFDGSRTGQAPGRDSDVQINPVAFYPDPFRRGNHVLVLCEAVFPDGKGTPIPTNTRRECVDIMARAVEAKPWFGLEQGFTLFHPDGLTPLGWPVHGHPLFKAGSYSSVGSKHCFGRLIIEAHYRACLYSGLGPESELMWSRPPETIFLCPFCLVPCSLSWQE